MKYYIGIDPSINSTGVCIIDENNKTELYIIKPDKLKKAEIKANENITELNYILYDKIDLKEYKEDNHISEYYKTVNIINIVNAIKDIVYKKKIQNDDNIYILMEGISYGSSLKTKSIYDLAGLNFLIRNAFIKNNYGIDLIISPPSEIKKFASGNGTCQKEVINNLFMCIFPEFNEYKIKIDDISDAYFMAQYRKSIEKGCN